MSPSRHTLRGPRDLNDRLHRLASLVKASELQRITQQVLEKLTQLHLIAIHRW